MNREQATTITQQECNTAKIKICLLTKSHFVLLRVAATGKSYLINAIRNLLQSRVVVTATKGNASHNINTFLVKITSCSQR